MAIGKIDVELTEEARELLDILRELKDFWSMPKPPKRGKWHRVEDELPELGKWVLVYNCEYKTVEKGRLIQVDYHPLKKSQWQYIQDSGITSWTDSQKYETGTEITHWRELHKPPKKGEE